MLAQEELEAVEPGRSRTLDISDFVDASEIDPIYYQKSYYLAPGRRDREEGVRLLSRRWTRPSASGSRRS